LLPQPPSPLQTKSIFRTVVVLVAVALLLVSVRSWRGARGQYSAEGERPTIAADSVDAATLAAGRAVFHGAGMCAACHGPKLEGGVGPTLKAHAWKDAKGGGEAAIYAVVTHGVPNTAMVAHPGGIGDAQAKQVATYVWAVSHDKATP
jgi:mono/diheme cytochrome c family protein